MGYKKVTSLIKDEVKYTDEVYHYGLSYRKNVGNHRVTITCHNVINLHIWDRVLTYSNELSCSAFRVVHKIDGEIMDSKECNSFTELIVGLIKLEEEMKETNKNIKT